MERGGFWVGFFYACVVCFLYFHPLFNTSANLFLYGALILLSFWAFTLHLVEPLWFAVLFGFLFAALLGIKNLVLTRRTAWARGIVYIVLYIALLLFFMQGFGGFFWVSWLTLLLIAGCALPTVIQGRALWGPALVLIGELAWVVSWLPIGFLSSANLTMLAILFMGDEAGEGRLHFKNVFIFIALVAVILLSSYWTLDSGF